MNNTAQIQYIMRVSKPICFLFKLAQRGNTTKNSDACRRIVHVFEDVDGVESLLNVSNCPRARLDAMSAISTRNKGTI